MQCFLFALCHCRLLFCPIGSQTGGDVDHLDDRLDAATARISKHASGTNFDVAFSLGEADKPVGPVSSTELHSNSHVESMVTISAPSMDELMSQSEGEAMRVNG